MYDLCVCKRTDACTSHFNGTQEIKQLHPHSSHSTTAFTMGPALTEVILFGGSPEVTTGYPRLVDTTLLKFGEFFQGKYIGGRKKESIDTDI